MTALINSSEILNSTLAVSGTFVTAILAVAPLLAACWLLLRAAGGRTMRQASRNDLGSLTQELQDNYERLRRSPEAIPLNQAAWNRLSDRITTLPASVATALRQTYKTIEISNRVLSSVDAYDNRGGLAVRHRRIALWPTLEAAVRSSLQALDIHPTPARQVGPRLVEPSRAARLAAPLPTAVQPFSLDRAPRLTIFYAAAPAVAAIDKSGGHVAARGPARPHRQKPSRKRAQNSARRSEGQMPLWESVVA